MIGACLLLPREGVTNGSTEAVQHERRDTHKRKLLKWAPHEYLDSVFHPRTLPIEPPKANDHPKPSEREEGPVDSPAQPIFRVSVPRLGDLSPKFSS